MKKVRVGIVGVGTIGAVHASTIFNGQVNGMELCALCDNDKKRAMELKERYSQIPVFEDYCIMLDSGLLDAIIIATPHYLHSEIAKCALEKGLHVLSEKPIGVYTLGVRKALEAQGKSGALYATMLNQRTNKLFMLAKDMVDKGMLGELLESNYTITNWYRTQEYYDSASWRGTWKGEGGGVLINQAPHNLDLWQWICGMPVFIEARCYEGKYHNIEVEDEAIIYAEYENGAKGTFTASTGIENGINRFEIIGALGKILIEKGKLICKVDGEAFEYLDEEYNGHLNILINFANAILKGEKLIAPASEAIRELIISNGAYLSSWKNEKIALPLNEEEFFAYLNEKIEGSYKKSEGKMESSFEKGYKKKWTTNW